MILTNNFMSNLKINTHQDYTFKLAVLNIHGLQELNTGSNNNKTLFL